LRALLPISVRATSKSGNIPQNERVQVMPKSFSQRELLEALVNISGVSKKDATSVLKALTDVIQSEIAKGGAVTIQGAIKIQCKDRPARMVRNPATGERIHKPADRRVSATPLKALKEAALREGS